MNLPSVLDYLHVFDLFSSLNAQHYGRVILALWYILLFQDSICYSL